MSSAHSPNFPSLHLRQNSLSNPSVALPTSQFILQPLRRFTYVTGHSLTLLSLYVRHSSFSNPSVVSPTSKPIFQPFSCLTYVTAHSPTLLSLYLRYSSFSNPSVASPKSQLILQTLLSLFLRHRLFTYVTWRAAHEVKNGWDKRGPIIDLHEQSSFSKLSVTSPTSQLILQPFRCFYVTGSSLTSPGEPPMNRSQSTFILGFKSKR